MLETIHRGIKRAMGKSKLSQLKPIKKRLIKKYEDLGEEFIDFEWIKKTSEELAGRH